jgi:hypothetical protein
MKTWIICLVAAALFTGPLAGADLLWDSNYNNYLRLLDRPKDQLSPQLVGYVETVKAGKVPSREEALRAVLRLADQGTPYLQDARLSLCVSGLYRVGRAIPNFASSTDFVWVIHAEIPGSGLVQVFYVSVSTAKVLKLFPEPPAAPNPKVKTGLVRRR